ncbi:MAG: CAP domain-containing protein [Planctomycetota bacterium]
MRTKATLFSTLAFLLTLESASGVWGQTPVVYPSAQPSVVPSNAVPVSGTVVSGPTVSTSTVPSVAASSGYVCPKCGRAHASNTTVSPVVTSYRPSIPAPVTSSPVVTSYRPTIPAPAIGSPVTTASYSTTVASPVPVSSRSAGGTQNVLSMLNAQRSRQGLRSLRYDPVLQAVAERRVQLMASTGRKGHPPGSFAPGRYEGVGWSSSFSPRGVSACYTSSPSMTVAGAAMARGRDGVYFAVVYR